MKMAADILAEGGNVDLTQSYRFYNPAVSYIRKSALPQTYPIIVTCLYNSAVSISISQPL
ncbi:hypothetical protein YC2023_058635 [Brassica napus]